MAPPGTLLRCPACGATLRAVLSGRAPTEWFACPHCRRPVPVVAPRELAPLYSWEVVGGLYPAIPIPRRPRWKSTTVVFVALVAIAALSLVVAGLLAYDGVRASAPAVFTIAGSVDGPGAYTGNRPIAGASVVLHGEDGFVDATTTDVQGRFSFGGVPSGGVNLSVTAPTYANATFVTFVSPVFSSGATGLTVDLQNSSAASSTFAAASPFGTMEGFLASVGAGVVLLAAIGGVAAFAGLSVRRPRSGTLVVLGGGAGLGAPAAFFVLGLSTPFPWLTLGAALAGGCGAFALAVGAAGLARGDLAPAAP